MTGPGPLSHTPGGLSAGSNANMAANTGSAIDWTRQQVQRLTKDQLDSVRDSYRNPQTPEEKKLKTVAQQFESVFIKQLMDTMDKTVDKTGLIDGGQGEETFHGMLNDEIAKKVASTGHGFGMAESVFRHMALQQLAIRKPEEVGATPQSSPAAVASAKRNYGLQLPQVLQPLPSMTSPGLGGFNSNTSGGGKNP
jgi:flagellar protein FlgJ